MEFYSKRSNAAIRTDEKSACPLSEKPVNWHGVVAVRMEEVCDGGDIAVDRQC